MTWQKSPKEFFPLWFWAQKQDVPLSLTNESHSLGHVEKNPALCLAFLLFRDFVFYIHTYTHSHTESVVTLA